MRPTSRILEYGGAKRPRVSRPALTGIHRIVSTMSPRVENVILAMCLSIKCSFKSVPTNARTVDCEHDKCTPTKAA